MVLMMLMLTVLVLVLVLLLLLAVVQVIVLGGPDVNRFASLTAAASPIVWCGKRIFCAIFIDHSKSSFCQDRLGTNIGKALITKMRFP
jgi:hypothetical protein